MLTTRSTVVRRVHEVWWPWVWPWNGLASYACWRQARDKHTVHNSLRQGRSRTFAYSVKRETISHAYIADIQWPLRLSLSTQSRVCPLWKTCTWYSHWFCGIGARDQEQNSLFWLHAFCSLELCMWICYRREQNLRCILRNASGHRFYTCTPTKLNGIPQQIKQYRVRSNVLKLFKMYTE